MLKLSQGLHQSSQHRWFQHAQVLIFSLVAVVVLAITSASPEAHAKRGRTKAEATAEDQQSAAPKRNASFAIAPEHGLIGIPVSAVEQGKEYLLSVSMIPQFGSATSHGNISRIVTFVRKGNDVIMLESTQGQVVTRDLPAKQILAIFSGAGSEAHEGLYLLKWDQGMTRLMFGGDWFTSDLSGKGFDPISINKALHELQNQHR